MAASSPAWNDWQELPKQCDGGGMVYSERLNTLYVMGCREDTGNNFVVNYTMIKSTVPSLKSHILGFFFRKVSSTSLSAHRRVGKLRIAIGTFLKKQRLHKAPWSFLRTTSSTWELLIIRVLVVLSLTCQAYSTWICARGQTHGKHNHLKSQVSDRTLKYSRTSI